LHTTSLFNFDLWNGERFLFLLAVIYLTISLSLVVFHQKCDALLIQPKTFWSIAFECISCPPFAVNLIRKITWQSNLNFNLIEFAQLHLSKDDFNKFVNKLISKIDERMMIEEIDSPQYEKLGAYKYQFQEMVL